MTKENKNIEQLLEHLSSAEADVREDAAANLVGITDEKLLPALVPALVKGLLDQHPGVKYFAKKALAAIQKEHGDIAALLKKIESDKKNAAEAGSKKSGAIGAASAKAVDVNATVRVAPAASGTGISSETAGMPSADSTVRIGRTGSEKSKTAAVPVETADNKADEVIPAPHAEDIAAAETKVNSGVSAEAAAVPLKPIDDAARAEINKIQIFIDNLDKSQIQNFITRLKTEENPYIKATLISAVGRLGSRANAELLFPFLSDQDTRVVANTVEALENLGNSKCIEPLIKIISHPDNRVRANVVKAIWKFASSNEMACRVIMDKLREMMFSAKPQMRESAIYVLSEIATEEALELLNITLNDKVDSIREKASEALQKAQAKFERNKAEAQEKESVSSTAEKEIVEDEEEAPIPSKKNTAAQAKKSVPLVAPKAKPQPVIKAQPAVLAKQNSGGNAVLIFTLVLLLIIGGGAGYWFGYEGRDFDSLIRLVTGENAPINENSSGSDNLKNPDGKPDMPAGETAEKTELPEKNTPAKSFSVKQQLDVAGEYLQSNFYNTAITEYSRILKIQPNNQEAKSGLLEAQYRFAEAYYNIGFYEKAKIEFEKTIKIDEKDTKFSAKAKELIGKIEKIK